MPRKKTKPARPMWEHLGAAITEIQISIESGINHKVLDKRYRCSDTSVYKFSRYISFNAVVIWPEEQVGEEIGFSLYKMPQHRADLKLHQLHLKNKITGEYRYEKHRGEPKPVYDNPTPIGLLEKNRKNDLGKQIWFGSADVSNDALNFIKSILLSSKQSYLHIIGTRDRRYIRLTNVSVSLGDPGDWEEFDNYRKIAQ